jgi:hypothetical protein
MACGATDLIHELASELASLAGVSSGVEAYREKSLIEIQSNLADHSGNGPYIKKGDCHLFRSPLEKGDCHLLLLKILKFD